MENKTHQGWRELKRVLMSWANSFQGEITMEGKVLISDENLHQKLDQILANQAEILTRLDQAIVSRDKPIKSGVKDPMLRIKGVSSMTGLSRVTIYRKINEGIFPKPFRLGPGSVGWKESQIERWLETRTNT